MEQEAFYKDQYDKTLDRKNEINTSLSTPIGILTALLAGLYFASTNFDFSDNKFLSISFIVISVVSICLLGKSIYHLIRAFSDFHNGYDYAYLNDTDVLDAYYQGLVNFYQSQPNSTLAGSIAEAKKEFDAYLLQELIKSAGINQKNNKSKIFQRFQCHQYMIYALIALSLLIIPFGIDFGVNKGKDKVQRVKIDSVIPVNLNIKYKDTVERLNIKTHCNGRSKKTNTSTNSNDKGRRKS
ncbi:MULTISPECIES: hypothetical protein [Mucilaginibacter]|jgi:hypothetical protein|uniref:SMODS and SLOG-associating 2TM effector domain-containing protein n=2 Tax=Mucilaginibacter TaxID=423349 RepID=A0A6I4I634_9SPHI|nr:MULTISPECIES: hypothetical protein [Mucilaginibacter]NCD67877.1 hypothetical protein [Mucilaginibacter agri]QQL50568.1 hypothetical protein GO620_003690 [Mucilaginibacter ginkgonis]